MTNKNWDLLKNQPLKDIVSILVCEYARIKDEQPNELDNELKKQIKAYSPKVDNAESNKIDQFLQLGFNNIISLNFDILKYSNLMFSLISAPEKKTKQIL